MEVVLVANEKGGVGKTCVAACLGGAISALGYRTCILDFDPSGNLSGSTLPEFPEYVLYDVFTGACSLDDAIYHTDICDIIPTIKELDLDITPEETYLLGAKDSKSLSNLASRLNGRDGAERVLHSLLHTPKHNLAERYDFIIIDSAPSDGLLVTNAIVAADSILIPTEPSADSLDGVWKFMSTMQAARRYGSHAKIDGIILTKCSEEYGSYRKSIQNIQQAAEARNIYLYNTRMRMSANIPDAMANCRPIMSYLNSPGHAAVDTLNLALEFLESRGLAPKTEIPGVSMDENGHWSYVRPGKKKREEI